jgi:hypothetical protein
MVNVKQTTNWFVEPLDAHTNQIISENLAKTGDGYSYSLEMTDNKGKAHDVFQIYKYPFINRLVKDRLKFDLKFNLYYRMGVVSPIKPWKLAEKPKKINLKLKKK